MVMALVVTNCNYIAHYSLGDSLRNELFPDSGSLAYIE